MHFATLFLHYLQTAYFHVDSDRPDIFLIKEHNRIPAYFPTIITDTPEKAEIDIQARAKSSLFCTCLVQLSLNTYSSFILFEIRPNQYDIFLYKYQRIYSYRVCYCWLKHTASVHRLRNKWPRVRCAHEISLVPSHTSLRRGLGRGRNRTDWTLSSSETKSRWWRVRIRTTVGWSLSCNRWTFARRWTWQYSFLSLEEK